MGSVIFHAAIAFMGCTIIGSLVDASAQITSDEVMAKIVIAIWISPATVVITAIVAVIPAVVASNAVAVTLPAAVVVPTTIITTVSALTIVRWVVIARAALIEWL
jgi:hypothetical protein